MKPIVDKAASTLALVLGAVVGSCDYAGTMFDDDLKTEKIDHAYRARDTCLKWAAMITDDGTDAPNEAGVRAAQACGEAIAVLISVTDPHGDPAIALSIRADSAFRATGYVIRGRNAAAHIVGSGAVHQKR